mmetsp:Transcript_48055/g.128153  ORF Transcript_48055/g.128153 Transcript_48055/m.128153 type:complete len:235 (-) Transcript_48055:935-1639(-)
MSPSTRAPYAHSAETAAMKSEGGTLLTHFSEKLPPERRCTAKKMLPPLTARMSWRLPRQSALHLHLVLRPPLPLAGLAAPLLRRPRERARDVPELVAQAAVRAPGGSLPRALLPGCRQEVPPGPRWPQLLQPAPEHENVGSGGRHAVHHTARGAGIDYMPRVRPRRLSVRRSRPRAEGSSRRGGHGMRMSFWGSSARVPRTCTSRRTRARAVAMCAWQFWAYSAGSRCSSRLGT